MQYVAFAGLSAILSLFVRARHLSTVTESAVLGVNRVKPTVQQESEALRNDHSQDRQAGDATELVENRS